MATRKQIKRDRKRRTHGIEKVVPDAAPKRETTREQTTAARGARNKKPVPYPTVLRALKRAPIFAAIWFVAIEYLFKSKGSSTMGNLATALLIAGVMVPAMYLTDRLAYRMAIKRGAPVQPPPQRG